MKLKHFLAPCLLAPQITDQMSFSNKIDEVAEKSPQQQLKVT
jgi:hypothetical protein